MADTELATVLSIDVRAIPPVDRHPQIFGAAAALAEGSSFIIVNDCPSSDHLAQIGSQISGVSASSWG
ncbi:DUF2249 domain-containing protein [Mesorhizobium sp. PAMC28654]|uniref:DUF2249 domain-containing protein n=1 Tax=Mesorhizobium sp. PAMC28654 TaxID=2880934 RepID=UPI001D0B60DC|nr:DUF2249 domain-containing protein [Mesorhizobium sp. PAMC28654]UDL90785.1 DUF2249 domain-containing protein [Mesorhizobium sp. PAMC28654]